MPVFDTFDDDLEDLAERCADADPGIRRVAMMALAEAVGLGATVLLLKGLADPDATVRAAAARALDEHDGPQVVEGLVRSLEDADEAVRRTAAEHPRGEEGAGLRTAPDRAGRACRPVRAGGRTPGPARAGASGCPRGGPSGPAQPRTGGPP